MAPVIMSPGGVRAWSLWTWLWEAEFSASSWRPDPCGVGALPGGEQGRTRWHARLLLVCLQKTAPTPSTRTTWASRPLPSTTTRLVRPAAGVGWGSSCLGGLGFSGESEACSGIALALWGGRGAVPGVPVPPSVHSLSATHEFPGSCRDPATPKDPGVHFQRSGMGSYPASREVTPPDTRFTSVLSGLVPGLVPLLPGLLRSGQRLCFHGREGGQGNCGRLPCQAAWRPLGPRSTAPCVLVAERTAPLGGAVVRLPWALTSSEPQPPESVALAPSFCTGAGLARETLPPALLLSVPRSASGRSSEDSHPAHPQAAWHSPPTFRTPSWPSPTKGLPRGP